LILLAGWLPDLQGGLSIEARKFIPDRWKQRPCRENVRFSWVLPARMAVLFTLSAGLAGNGEQGLALGGALVYPFSSAPLPLRVHVSPL
jgi:hypothetical protein